MISKCQTMNKPNPEVDAFISKSKKWRKELAKLRKIVLACGLAEDFKWRAPCFTFQKKNIVILGDLKDCCTINFFKGALLTDPHDILRKPGENTQAGRVIRFTSVRDIAEMETILKSYIREAVEVEKAGLKVDVDKNRKLDIPEELQDRFNQMPALKTAFEALTPGRQRAYVLHFSGAKQSTTRASRVEKSIPRILDGKGFNDCVCGLSRKQPHCDGSHKTIR